MARSRLTHNGLHRQASSFRQSEFAPDRIGLSFGVNVDANVLLLLRRRLQRIPIERRQFIQRSVDATKRLHVRQFDLHEYRIFVFQRRISGGDYIGSVGRRFSSDRPFDRFKQRRRRYHDEFLLENVQFDFENVRRRDRIIINGGGGSYFIQRSNRRLHVGIDRFGVVGDVSVQYESDGQQSCGTEGDEN